MPTEHLTTALLKRSIGAVRKSGQDEIAELFTRVVTWYEALPTPNEAQHAIAGAAYAAVEPLIGGSDRSTQTQVDDFTRSRNVLRMCVVPESHMIPAQRTALLARAVAGEDVYCYGSVNSSTGIINLWDTDTRIPLFPLSQQRWTLTEARMSNIARHSALWALQFAPVSDGQTQTVLLYIERQAGEDDALYQPRAGRVAQLIMGNVNLFADEPAKYHGCHF